MGKTLACKDVGVACDTVLKGKDEAEIMGKAAEHAKSCHTGIQLTPEVIAKVKAAIKEDKGECCGGHSCG